MASLTVELEENSLTRISQIGLKTQPLERSITARNVDGTEQNPDIDWKTGRFDWQNQYPGLTRLLRKYQGKPAPLLRAKTLARMAMESKLTIVEEPDEEENLNRTQNPTKNDEILLAYMEEAQKPNEIWINAKTSNAIEFHLKHDEKKDNLI